MKLNNKRGVTLIELIISLAIFVIVVVIVLSIFIDIIRYTRESTQKQSLQDHAQFLFALMSKEIRMAKINKEGACDAYFKDVDNNPATTFLIGPNQLYVTNSSHNELRLMNYNGECVRYFTKDDVNNNLNKRLIAERCLPDGSTDGCSSKKTYYVTPGAFKIENLYFSITNFSEDDQVDITELKPPTVSYSLKIKSISWDFDYYNFITARNIDQF